MLGFLSENLGTFAAGSVVLAIIVLAIIKTAGNTRRDAGCGCADFDAGGKETERGK